MRTMVEAPTLLSMDRKDRGDFLRYFYRRYEDAPVEQIEIDAREMLTQIIVAKSFPAAIRRVREHRALGHKTILITGALSFNVEGLRPLFDEIVAAEKGCLVWGGHANLSPADDVLISVERPLAIDTPEQMVASILSKKLAAGSTHLVLDLPVGPTAKLRDRERFVRLRKLFEYVSDQVGINTTVLATDGSQPIGRGIGPWLEARDVMQVLERHPDAPRDLEERAVLLAGHVLEFDPALRGGQGIVRARELLHSGAALAKMRRLIAAQGAPPQATSLGTLTHDVPATEDGVVTAIDCLRLARVARLAGAPMDKGAGVDLFKRIGDPVERGEPLYRIHAAFEADFRFATQLAAAEDGMTIGRRA
jgi:thymidine phosphorylase